MAPAIPLFAVATGTQLLLYGGSLWGGGPIWTRPGLLSCNGLYGPLVFFFCFGPAILAGCAALWLARRLLARHLTKPPLFLVAALVALGVVSACLGMLIALNIWGT